MWNITLQMDARIRVEVLEAAMPYKESIVKLYIFSKSSYGNFFFRGGVCRPFRKMVNIFAYTCPNRSGVGAINNPDRSEQVFDAYYISEVSKKIFMDDISMVRP